MSLMDQDTEDSKKRPRDESECDSPESKLVRVHSAAQDNNSSDLDATEPDSVENNENRRESNDSPGKSPEAKRIQDDLFNILDESDEPAIQGLDSIIRSFEEEILVPASIQASVGTDVTSFGNGSQPDLGYLLEASDDELGLPPTFSGEEEKVSGGDVAVKTGGSTAAGFDELLGLEDQIPHYDSFEFGLADDSGRHSYNDTGDFVSLGGLFDYSDEYYVPAQMSGVQWLPKSLSAV